MWMITNILQKSLAILFPTRCYLCKKSEIALCDQCLDSLSLPLSTPYFWTDSCYSFKDNRVKKIIHAIKFFHRKDLVLPISKRLVDLLPPEASSWVLVPVPAHFLRTMGRGYNQAELLAKCLHKLSGLPIDTQILKKTKYTNRQAVAQSKKERLKQQSNTFAVISNVDHKNIILVDDVLTTGATLSEARKVLLQAGAQEVRAVTVAH